MSERGTLREHARQASQGNREAHAYYMARGAYFALSGRRGRAMERRWNRRADRLFYARRAAEGRRWDDRDAYERPEGAGRWP